MDQFADILKNELKPGEEVLWQDQPIPELYAKAYKSKKTVFEFRVQVGVLLLCLCFAYAAHEKPLFYGFMLTSAILFCSLASISSKQFRIYKNAEQYLYVITNQRLIFIGLRPRVVVVSHAAADVFNSSYTKTYNADGSGDILFKTTKMVQLTALKDVKKVADIIDKWKESTRS